MARIGAFCFPGTGHINPITALARRLRQRGHTVVIFGIADIEAPAETCSNGVLPDGRERLSAGYVEETGPAFERAQRSRNLPLHSRAGQEHRADDSPRRATGSSPRQVRCPTG